MYCSHSSISRNDVNIITRIILLIGSLFRIFVAKPKSFPLQAFHYTLGRQLLIVVLLIYKTFCVTTRVSFQLEYVHYKSILPQASQGNNCFLQNKQLTKQIVYKSSAVSTKIFFYTIYYIIKEDLTNIVQRQFMTFD